MGIVEGDVPYYYVTNLQGDVIGIVEKTTGWWINADDSQIIDDSARDKKTPSRRIYVRWDGAFCIKGKLNIPTEHLAEHSAEGDPFHRLCGGQGQF